MLFYLFSAETLTALFERLGYPLRPDDDSAERRLLPAADVARLDAEQRDPLLGRRRAPTAKAPGGCSPRRCAATSTTCRAAPRPKASTSARWPARSTCSNAATPGWNCATTCCTSRRAARPAVGTEDPAALPRPHAGGRSRRPHADDQFGGGRRPADPRRLRRPRREPVAGNQRAVRHRLTPAPAKEARSGSRQHLDAHLDRRPAGGRQRRAQRRHQLAQLGCRRRVADQHDPCRVVQRPGPDRRQQRRRQQRLHGAPAAPSSRRRVSSAPTARRCRPVRRPAVGCSVPARTSPQSKRRPLAIRHGRGPAAGGGQGPGARLDCFFLPDWRPAGRRAGLQELRARPGDRQRSQRCGRRFDVRHSLAVPSGWPQIAVTASPRSVDRSACPPARDPRSNPAPTPHVAQAPHLDFRQPQRPAAEAVPAGRAAGQRARAAVRGARRRRAARQDRRVPRRASPPARRSTRCCPRPSPSCAKAASAR